MVSDIKTSVVRCLSDRTDAILSPEGFVRPAKAVEFVHKLPNVHQVFAVSLAVRPSYSRDALAHVYPSVRLSMADVCSVARQLVEGDPVLLANAPEVMVNRPLEHLIPKPHRVQWYAFREEDFQRIAGEVAESCMKWGLPFFDDYRSAQDVVRGFEAGDDRPKLQENWAIFVVAAYVVLGQRKRAEEVLEASFSTLGSRKKYAAVFKNLKTFDELPTPGFAVGLGSYRTDLMRQDQARKIRSGL